MSERVRVLFESLHMALGQKEAEHSSSSFFGGLWQAWLRKRRKDRVRSLSTVRFRLTREGMHYIGILVFIFVGAMLRDINLLILLAGAMIGLLLLQWRFNTRTLQRLGATRRLQRHTHVGAETEVTVRVTNPKPWLGAWLVVVEDPLQKLVPTSSRLPVKGVAVLDEIRPANTASTNYRLTFHKRGRYQVGPSTISTRFPLGLGRASLTIDNSSQITVFPLLGKLTPRIDKIFQQEMNGNAMVSRKAGLHEADFYGLRPWATGDSRRWIHWRTTARLGELSVRQFERQQRRQVCVLLDLYQPEPIKAGENPHVELAISFLATLANATARFSSDRLAVAVAGSENFSLPNVQSSTLVENLFERLSVISASSQPKILEALQGITIPLLSNPHLIVVSTRDDQINQLRQSPARERSGNRLLSRLQVKWLNVSRGDLEAYFSWA